MIDVHSHILPSIDDGAEDMEEAIEMARIYVKNGVDKVISTPHFIEGAYDSRREKNLALLSRLNESLSEEGLNLKVYIGNEIYISPDVYKYIREGRVSSLNSSRYLLLELPMFDIPLYVENLIYELLLKGYIPIIAHPERNAKIIEDPNILYNFIKKGALAQLNLPSLEGKYGDKIKTTGEILLKHNMIHFVGTDAHSPRRRSPNIEKSLEVLKKLVDRETFNKITYINGQCILDNKMIEADSPVEYKKQKSFLYFLKTKINL